MLPAASRYVVKLGARYGVTGRGALVPQVRYEWQVRPGWGLQIGAGYGVESSTLGFYRQLHNTFWTTEVSSLFYLPRPRAQPLTGWFAGVGAGTLYRSTRDQNSSGPPEEVRRVWALESRLQVGRQAAVGQRLVVQGYLATTFTYFFASFDTPSGVFVRELGASLGYRF